MRSHKSYGQFCGLARALDHVGDRWTLLIVRELLTGPKTFRAVLEALGGISPVLLTERLQRLAEDGLASRNAAAARSKAVTYHLTAAGQTLEPAVVELIRWGAMWMTSGPGADQAAPHWAPLAVRAMLDGQPAPPGSQGAVHIVVGDHWTTVEALDGTLHVRAGRHGEAAATLTGTLPDVLALCSGLRQPAELALEASGDPAALKALNGSLGGAGGI